MEIKDKEKYTKALWESLSRNEFSAANQEKQEIELGDLILIKAPEGGSNWSQDFRAGIVTSISKNESGELTRVSVNDTYDSFEDGWPAFQDTPYPIKDCVLLIKKRWLFLWN